MCQLELDVRLADLVLFQNSAERESVSLQGFGRPAAHYSLSTWRVWNPFLLRRTVASYVERYHLERPHQGIGNRPIEGVPEPCGFPERLPRREPVPAASRLPAASEEQARVFEDPG